MSDFTNLTTFLNERLDGNFMPGFDCRVFHNGIEVYRHMNGYSDIENKIKVNGDEAYFMYSCTKPVTCAAAMKAFEEGKFLFTDNVSDFLPEFADCVVKIEKEDGTIEYEKLKRPIRIQDLFTMSSGIIGYRRQPNIATAIKGKEESVTTREMTKAIACAPLEFQPGEDYLYGLSHDVLACLVEVAVGMSFNDYVKKVIFEPLEMHNSSYRLTNELKKRLAQQYTRDITTREISVFGKHNFAVSSNLHDSGGAGLITTMEDYSKFACAMANFGLGLNGNRILNKSTVNLMRTNLLKGKPFESFRLWAGNAEYGYGYGVRTKMEPGWGGNLTSIGEFGWDGAAGSLISIDPDRNIAIIYLQHMLNPYLLEIHPRIKNMVHLALGY